MGRIKREMVQNELFGENTSNEALFTYFGIYGVHDAGILLCNRANDGDQDALVYAQKIWNKEVVI